VRLRLARILATGLYLFGLAVGLLTLGGRLRRGR